MKDISAREELFKDTFLKYKNYDVHDDEDINLMVRDWAENVCKEVFSPNVNDASELNAFVKNILQSVDGDAQAANIQVLSFFVDYDNFDVKCIAYSEAHELDVANKQLSCNSDDEVYAEYMHARCHLHYLENASDSIFIDADEVEDEELEEFVEDLGSEARGFSWDTLQCAIEQAVSEVTLNKVKFPFVVAIETNYDEGDVDCISVIPGEK